MDHIDPVWWYSPRGEAIHEIETCELVGGAADGRAVDSRADAPATGCAASKNPSYLGADISGLAQVEARGGVYLDDGKPGDAIDLL